MVSHWEKIDKIFLKSTLTFNAHDKNMKKSDHTNITMWNIKSRGIQLKFKEVQLNKTSISQVAK